ncbi:MAG: polysaccharide biosynthesis/export family protein [Pseudomonadota bacterium]
MTSALSRAGRFGLVLAASLALSACAVPRSGPDRDEITTTEGAALPFTVVPVTADVTRLTRQEEALGFSRLFRDTSPEDTSRLAAGDVLSITVWENSETGLLNPQGIGPTTLPQIRVDPDGFVHVPYVGRVRASGRTMSQLRSRIEAQLRERTLNPQVDVFPHASEARIVSVQGVVGTPGLYTIRNGARRVLPMLAQAGGVKTDPEVVRVRVRRGAETGEIWLQDLYDAPDQNVALRAGDAIIAERDRRIFTALGAVGKSTTVPFSVRELSAARALGQIGGLIETTADPTGIFVFRDESETVFRSLPGTGPALASQGTRRVVYVIDLIEPGGVFLARDFIMRDGDTLYVTTAPFVQFQKILQSIAPVLGLAGTSRSLSGL